MKKPLGFVVFLFFTWVAMLAQLETSKWYFGSTAAVDFLSGSPVALTNSVMNSSEGSASIADAAGNLLFYTNGNTVWNANHVAMPNGTGLFGSSISCQSAVIVQQPGSATVYYIFTMRNWTDGGNGAHLSIVDMSLAGGFGDVTTKNQLIYGNTRESLTAVCHNNGTDIWIVLHDMFTSDFNAYLLTAGGFSPVPVISATGSVFTGGNRYGSLKASPDGTRLGYALGGSGGVTTEIYDFDRSTGVVSNPLILNNGTFPNAYGIEFSPDNQVLYVCQYNGSTIQQFNLAAGSPALVLASNTVISSGGNVKANLQAGPDGRIYVCLAYQAFLAVITNPNTLGLGCNFINNSLGLAGRTCGLGLPNFMPCLIPVIVPVTWTYFHAAPAGNAVRLNWGASFDHDVKEFSMERRSKAETAFTPIGQLVPGTPAGTDFEWVDAAPKTGLNEYRIKAEDLDGGTYFSEVLTVEFASTNTMLQLFPNPLAENGILNIRLGDFGGNLRIAALDMLRRTVFEQEATLEPGQPIQLFVGNVPSGIYCLNVRMEDGGVVQSKFMR